MKSPYRNEDGSLKSLKNVTPAMKPFLIDLYIAEEWTERMELSWEKFRKMKSDRISI